MSEEKTPKQIEDELCYKMVKYYTKSMKEFEALFLEQKTGLEYWNRRMEENLK